MGHHAKRSVRNESEPQILVCTKLVLLEYTTYSRDVTHVNIEVILPVESSVFH